MGCFSKVAKKVNDASSHSWLTGDTHWRKAFLSAKCMHMHPFGRQRSSVATAFGLLNLQIHKELCQKRVYISFSLKVLKSFLPTTRFHKWHKEIGLHSSRTCSPLLKQQTRTRAPAHRNNTMWKADPQDMASQERNLDTQNLCREVFKKMTL